MFLFTWAYIPETRDRTLEEINEIFEAKVPARKFKSYVCVGTEAVREAVVEEKNARTTHVEVLP